MSLFISFLENKQRFKFDYMVKKLFFPEYKSEIINTNLSNSYSINVLKRTMAFFGKIIVSKLCFDLQFSY